MQYPGKMVFPVPASVAEMPMVRVRATLRARVMQTVTEMPTVKLRARMKVSMKPLVLAIVWEESVNCM